MRPLAVLLVLLVASGCVSTRSVPAGPGARVEVNRLVAGRPATLFLADGRSAQTRGLHLAADTTTWIDERTGAFERAATADVRAVHRRNRGRGAVRAGLTAAVVAGVTTAIYSFNALQADGCTSGLVDPCGVEANALLSAAAGTAVGLVAAVPAALVGAVVGELEEVVVVPRAPALGEAAQGVRLDSLARRLGPAPR